MSGRSERHRLVPKRPLGIESGKGTTVANENQNLLGIQTNADDVLSNNDLNSHNDNSVETEVEVEFEDSFNDNSVETEVEVEFEDSFNDNSDNSDNSVNTDTEVEVEFEDSFNDNSDNSVNTDTEVEVEFEDSFNDNSDNSVDNSVEVEFEDSFNDNSDNSVDNSVETETEVEIEESFNGSFNDDSTNVDVEVELKDSFNDNSDNSVRNQDSFNITSSFNTQTLNDHSTTIGVRQYNSGFGDFNLGGLLGGAAPLAAKGHAGAGGGFDLDLDNRSLQLDQSVSQVIQTGEGSAVTQAFAQNATVAFGDDSIAAGRDVSIDNSVFEWKMGDVNIGNTAIDTRINDSFNDFSENFDVELDVEVDDSFNDQSDHTNVDVDVEDSFTSEIDSTFSKSLEWENSGNFFSPGAATSGGEADVDF